MWVDVDGRDRLPREVSSQAGGKQEEPIGQGRHLPAPAFRLPGFTEHAVGMISKRKADDGSYLIQVSVF